MDSDPDWHQTRKSDLNPDPDQHQARKFVPDLDPDWHQNVADPQHCCTGSKFNNFQFWKTCTNRINISTQSK